MSRGRETTFKWSATVLAWVLLFAVCSCSNDQSAELDAATSSILDGSSADGATGEDAIVAEGNDAIGVQPDGGTAQLHSEIFVGLAINLISSANLEVTFVLGDLTTDLEFYAVRELRGFTEVKDVDTGSVVLAIDASPLEYPEVGVVSGPLPQGSYTAYLENLGGSTAIDNDYVAVQVIRRPMYDGSVATFESTIIDSSGFVDPTKGVVSSFTTRADRRYVIRGIRGRNTVWILAADQLPRLEAGMSFSVRYQWNETNFAFAPNATAMTLEPGDYAVVMANLAGDGAVHGSVIRIDEWRMQQSAKASALTSRVELAAGMTISAVNGRPVRSAGASESPRPMDQRAELH